MNIVRSACTQSRMARCICLSLSAWLAIALLPPVAHAAGIGGGGNPPTIPGRGAQGQPQGSATSTGAAGSASGPARGASPSAPPAMSTTPVLVPPQQKKPIQINPALLNALYPALLKTDTKAEREELEAALKGATQKEHSVYLALWYYQNHVNQCASKQHTVEEQKQAGCLGTDTLDQCSSKLFHHCVGSGKYHQQKFHAERKSMLEATDRLDKALKAYAVKLKIIP